MKDIQFVQPICEHRTLAEIYCFHEDLNKTNWLRETFFIDKDCRIVAHFKQNSPFSVRQLTQQTNCLFVIKNYRDNIYHIVQVFYDTDFTPINSYEDIEFGIEDGCIAVKYNGLWGFINKEAEEIIEPQYEDYCAFSSGFAAVCKNGKWGFINKQNEVIIPFEYEIPEYSCFNKYYAPAGKNGKFGFIDNSNETVIPFKYENALIRSRYGKLFPVKQNGKWKFIDYKERKVIQLEFDDVECNSDGYSVYHVMKKSDDKELNGLVDARTNKLLVPCEYLSLCPNPNSIQAQKQNNKYVLLNWNGEEISEEYDFIEEYSNGGLYIARNDSKEGYINENGDVEIPFIYQKCEDFYGGFAVVKNQDGTKYIINRKDRVVFKTSSENKVYNLGAKMFLIQKTEFKIYELVKFKE